jgi:HAD superfamily hydrolase (TIGR01548 family)
VTAAKFPWQAIVFDVDGVLVDVRDSYQRTVLETLEAFTGKRATRRELHEWKNRPGFNDDWKLTHAWIESLGGRATYAEVKRKFEQLYWGENGAGNVARERWLLPAAELESLARRAELAIFTGRTREELDHTLENSGARKYFSKVVTVESVANPKPHPEGLRMILAGRPPQTALYIGDNVDDALAARDAGVAFLGVLPQQSEERRIRAPKLNELGARAILGDITELEDWLASTASAAS